MPYIHRHYIHRFLHQLTEKDNLSSSVMKACSSIITDERLDVSSSEVCLDCLLLLLLSYFLFCFELL
jgi:hypothetical protein